MAPPAISQAASRGSVSRGWVAPTFLGAIFALLLLTTRPTYIGDTFWYVADIDRWLGRGWPHSQEIWNFAHLLLRPTGLLLSQFFLGIVLPWFGGNRQTAIAFLLILPSAAATFVCALFVHRMTRRITHANGVSILVAAAFLCLSVVLNYSRSGASYMPGLAFSMAALYLAGFFPARTPLVALWAGALAGISVLFWLPYIASFPAILAAGPILNPGGDRKHGQVRFAAALLAGAGIVLLAGYGIGAASTHVNTWSSLVSWIRDSDTQLRDRKLLRMVTGFARSFYELGNTAVSLKWFLFKDPYAKVGFLDILQPALLKPAAFYGSLAGLAFLLWATRVGRALLLLSAIALLPHIGMALAFESGSPERYLPALPLVFVGFGQAIAAPAFGFRTRAVAAMLCCAHIPVNMAALSSWAVDGAIGQDAARISALVSLNPASRVYVVNGFDGLFVLRQSRPFHPLNQRPWPELASIVPLGPRVPFWRSDFACTALSTWDHGGELWITRRVLSSRPERGWFWVEGDDRRLSWAALHGFFSALKRGGEAGGPDGFFLAAQDGVSRSAMVANVPAGDPRNCPAAGGSN